MSLNLVIINSLLGSRIGDFQGEHVTSTGNPVGNAPEDLTSHSDSFASPSTLLSPAGPPKDLSPYFKNKQGATQAAKLEKFLQELQDNPELQKQMEFEVGLMELGQGAGLIQAFEVALGELTAADAEFVSAYQGTLVKAGNVYRGHLESKVRHEEELVRQLEKEYRKSRDAGGGKFMVPSSDLDLNTPGLVQAKAELAAWENKFLRLESLNFEDPETFAKNLEELSVFADEVHRGQEEHVRSLLFQKLEAVESIPSGVDNLSTLRKALEATQVSSPREAGPNLAEYSRISRELEIAALGRTIDAGLLSLEGLEATINLTDRMINKVSGFFRSSNSLAFSLGVPGLILNKSLGKDYESLWAGRPDKLVDYSTHFKILRPKYQKAQKLFQQGDYAKAQKLFLEASQTGLMEDILAQVEDSQSLNFSAGMAIITASAVTGAIFAEFVVGLGVGAGLLAEGSLATYLTWQGANALAFTAAEHGMTHAWEGKAYFDPNKTGLQNAGEFGAESAKNFALFVFLGGAGKGYNRLVLREALPQAEKAALARMGGDASKVTPRIVDEELARLAPQRGVKALKFKAGGFTTEYGAFASWEYLDTTVRLAMEGEFRPISVAEQVLSPEAGKERLKMLLGLKMGNRLFHPVSGSLVPQTRAKGEILGKQARKYWDNLPPPSGPFGVAMTVEGIPLSLSRQGPRSENTVLMMVNDSPSGKSSRKDGEKTSIQEETSLVPKQNQDIAAKPKSSRSVGLVFKKISQAIIQLKLELDQAWQEDTKDIFEWIEDNFIGRWVVFRGGIIGIKHGDPQQRKEAILDISKYLSRMNDTERLQLATKELDSNLDNKRPGVREMAILSSEIIIPYLAESNRLLLAFEIEKRLSNDNQEIRISAGTALGKIAHHLSQASLDALTLKISERRGLKDPAMAESAEEALEAIRSNHSPLLFR